LNKAPTNMTAQERKAALALASIYALRMFGLFSILPVFSIYGRALQGGEASYMVALALSIYGLTQALFYIAYGAASDRFGRKPVIIIGLLVFAAGSVVAALSTSVAGVVLGRALQGAGAVSSAITALVADHTRDSVRSKAMAMVGGSIGVTFALALVVAPPLAASIGVQGIFWITAAFALLAIFVLTLAVPDAPTAPEPAEPLRHGDVLFHPQLFRLNFGVFVLHCTLMAVFVVIPPLLVQYGQLPAAQHGWVYLPVLVASFAMMVPAMIAAEKKGKVRSVFLLGVTILLLTFAFAPMAAQAGRIALIIFLLAFFFAFNLLEALQPSLVSRLAPPHMKGFALGVYNTTQAMGLFLGGILGGVVTKRLGDNSVFWLCAGLCALWLVVAWGMKPPPKK
jgi:MFS family permease